MNRLKSKASQLFKNAPSQDEKAANASPGQETGFDAGIERNLQKKPSRFFRKQADKPLPAPPPAESPEALPPTWRTDVVGDEEALLHVVPERTAGAKNEPFSSRPASAHSTKPEAQIITRDVSGAPRTLSKADPVVKKRPSFASLRKSSSRIFRPATVAQDPPPPPVPQIPINTPTPKPRRPVLRPLVTALHTRSSLPSPIRNFSISRPVSSVQVSSGPAPFNVPTVPFVKPHGPPPPRPPRPDSVDWELVALSRDVGSRMVLPALQHTRPATVSTTSSARSRALTRVQSEEVCARLGLPSGHSSVSTPRSQTFDSPLSSPLAAKFPLDPSRPLPFRDSSGSVKGYGRFSAYIKARQQYSSGTYEDGIDPDDRDIGPIEQYRASKCADWTLEKRISGKLGERGMLFKDHRGGWHFVADI